METLIIEMNKIANVRVLSLNSKGEFQIELENRGIKVDYYLSPYKNFIFKIIDECRYLLHYIYTNEIDTIWSHLHPCNLYAAIASKFSNRRFVIFRHHFHAQIKIDGWKSVNKNERLTEKLICILSKEIAVPSTEVKIGMIKYENVPSKKILLAPYIYDFSRYPSPNLERVENIRQRHNAKTLILVASRMIPLKRHFLVLPVFKKLIDEGLDIQVILLDDGPLRNNIQEYISQNNLKNQIILEGYKKNIIDYISAADIIVHPSYTEASSSLIKEAGLQKKRVIVCSGVGDFDDYIVNGVSGYVINSNEEFNAFESSIRIIHNSPEESDNFGEELKKAVVRNFSCSEMTLKIYKSLL